MKAFVLIPTLHHIWGGIKKLLDYADHLSTEHETFRVNMNSKDSSIDKDYGVLSNVINEATFRKMVGPNEPVLFAPTTLYNNIKDLKKPRKILIEMGFAGRNCDYADSIYVLDKIDEIICYGQIISDDIFRNCGKRFPVIPIGIDLNKFNEKPEKRQKNLIRIYVDAKQVIPISTNDWWGRLEVGSLEMAKYLDEYVLPTFFGLKKEKDYHFHTIDRRGNYTQVQMIDFYQTADIFVSVNRYEGPFLVVLEAMACGAACVVADAKGTDDLVIPWKTALRTAPCQISSTGESIKRLMQNPELKETIRKGGLEMAKQHSLEQEKEKLLAYIKK